MNIMLIIEHRASDPVRVHRVDMTGSSKRDAYLSLKSLNGYRRRERNRTNKFYSAQKSPPFDYLIMFEHDWKLECAVFGSINELPEVEHASIWEFYKAVGFDHRKNKYDT